MTLRTYTRRLATISQQPIVRPLLDTTIACDHRATLEPQAIYTFLAAFTGNILKRPGRSKTCLSQPLVLHLCTATGWQADKLCKSQATSTRDATERSTLCSMWREWILRADGWV